ncbi:hypothetical protein HDZ31DRAFT_64366 [Schizophyllum fasciatum]
MPYCKTCDRRFRDAASLQQHLRTSAAEHPKCDVCNRKFTDETAYEQHMESKHPKKYPCPTHPNSVFNTPEALEDHYRGSLSHPNCWRCGKGYLNEELMMEHHDAAHPNEMCQMCGGHRIVYQDQQKKHWQQSRWHPTCERCGEGFYNSLAVLRHLRAGCGRETCEACGKVFVCEEKVEGAVLCDPCLGCNEQYFTAPTSAPDLKPFSLGPDGKAVPLPQPSMSSCTKWHLVENWTNPSPSLQLITREHSVASRAALPMLETQMPAKASRSTTLVDNLTNSDAPPAPDPSPNVESPSSLMALPGVSPYPSTPSEISRNASREAGAPRIRSISGLYSNSSAEALAVKTNTMDGRLPCDFSWPMGLRAAASGGAKDLQTMSPIEAEKSPIEAEKPLVEAEKSPVGAEKSPFEVEQSPLDAMPDLPEGMRVSMFDDILAAPLPGSDAGGSVSSLGSPSTRVSGESLGSDATKADVEEVIGSKALAEGTSPSPAIIVSPPKGVDAPGKAIEAPRKKNDPPETATERRTLRRTSHLPRPVEQAKPLPRPGMSPPPSYSEMLKCRSCSRNPCEEPTVTMCGHLFCNKCIVDAIMTGSSCPLCSAPQLLYCIFKLRLD